MVTSVFLTRSVSRLLCFAATSALDPLVTGCSSFQIPSLLRLSRFCSGSFQISIIAKIAGPGRKRRNSDPDPSSGSDSGDGQPVSAKCLKMSSDGGNSALGGDAAAHRGGSQQRRGHGREAASDLSSCSSKKKQKDRANQESREAKRAVAVVDAVIAEVRKGNLELARSLTLVPVSGW